MAVAALSTRRGSGQLVSRARWRHGTPHAQSHGSGDGAPASDRLMAVRDAGGGGGRGGFQIRGGSPHRVEPDCQTPTPPITKGGGYPYFTGGPNAAFKK